ncbi:N-acetyltransferase [Roseovarius faecimaris]|uniref:N-acetyltransferase n=1 Tax=Roseovarius faecimaris TaxID=2494550 RepID=A0A6I6IN54_9RHOB|nr:GNAT family N-acetyltransferase [Roseovarius faecimaris]QGX98540.1 N-acetyltransferase [Roseovarius faecimaris]
MTEIATQRLILRPVAEADADAVHSAMASDFDVVRHTGTWPWPATPEATRGKCAVGFGTQGGWMVASLDGRIIGMVGMGPDGDFGYMLARAAWGQGFATEMAQALIGHIEDSGSPGALKACVFDDNPASARVLAKLGFSEGPACSGHCAARGGDFPIRTFTLALPRA